MAWYLNGVLVLDNEHNFSANSGIIGSISSVEGIDFFNYYTVNAGYVSTGVFTPGAPTNFTTAVDKFPFATNVGVALTLGSAPTAVGGKMTGHSSDSAGFNAGGSTPPAPTTAATTLMAFPFATGVTHNITSTITTARNDAVGLSSTTSGYVGAESNPTATNSIDKFPFASLSGAAISGYLLGARCGSGKNGIQNLENGYILGTPVPTISLPNMEMHKVNFATDAVSTTGTRMYVSRSNIGTLDSSDHGYAGGGQYANPPTFPGFGNIIDKFPFATDQSATLVGSLIAAGTPRISAAGVSSISDGYFCGGGPAGASLNSIDKFPFATDTNSTDVGDLTTTRLFSAGHQG